MKKITLILLTFLFFSISANADNPFYYEYGKRVELKKLSKTSNRNGDAIDYYEDSNGREVGVKNQIIVKCKEGLDCYAIFEKHNLTNIEKLSTNFFLIKLTNEDVFELSQTLYNEEDIEISQPNLVRKLQKR